MAYSTIKKKKCKCGTCNNYPTIGYSGYNRSCAPADIKEKQDSKTQRQRTESDKRKMAKVRTLIQEPSSDDIKGELWFRSKRHQMTGFCACGCDNKSSKDDAKHFKFSAAHILPKSKFESVKWHPDNWVELAFWGGCHTVFDDKGYEYCKQTKPILWEIVVQKFKIVYPFISPDEMKYVPNILLETLKHTQ